MNLHLLKKVYIGQNAFGTYLSLNKDEDKELIHLETLGYINIFEFIGRNGENMMQPERKKGNKF